MRKRSLYFRFVSASHYHGTNPLCQDYWHIKKFAVVMCYRDEGVILSIGKCSKGIWRNDNRFLFEDTLPVAHNLAIHDNAFASRALLRVNMSTSKTLPPEPSRQSVSAPHMAVRP